MKDKLENFGMISCKCGGLALLHSDDVKKHGKLWTVFRCMRCGADIHIDPKEIKVGNPQ